MSSHTSRALATAALALALTSCGDGGDAPLNGPNGYALRGTSPYPEQLAAGTSVRNLILRAETRAGADMRGERCGYSLILFDVTTASTQTPTAVGSTGDCKLYMSPPENDYNAQRWLCAGALDFESGSIMQTTPFCPPAGATAPWENSFSTCGAFLSDRSARVASVEGVDGAVVTDLMATLRFPTTPVVTLPSTFTVTTWPAAGDLTVAWTSADATDAVVRIEPDGATRSGPTIVCSPRINGTIRIDAALLDRGGFRGMNGRLRVWSYRETPARAEGHAWNLVGAIGTSLLLQPGR